MRTIVIGDVHGCLHELQDLLRALQPRQGDRLIFVGDLVDKGPYSLETLRYVRSLTHLFPGSVVVSGNHEEKALRDHARGIGELWVSQAEPDDLDFMLSMPLTWYDEHLDLRVVHGGIFPALLDKHPDVWTQIEQRGLLWRKGGGKIMDRARRMLRTRYVDFATGDMLALGKNRPNVDPFWADVYDGAAGYVVFGHDPAEQVRHWHDALGIDTGCVYGWSLTAAVFDDQEDPQIVSVPALAQYAEPLVEGGC